MNISKSICISLSLLIGGLSTANATEILKYDGSPLKISLKTEQERLIRLPDNAMFRIPENLKDVLSVDSVAGVLYMTCRKDLTDIPIEIKLADTKEIIKLYVSSNLKAKNTDDEVRIVMPWESENVTNALPVKVLPNADSQRISSLDTDSIFNNAPVTANEFIRYAAMRTFMPMRLWKDNTQIHKLPVKGYKEINFTNLFYGSSSGVFNASVEAAYQSGDQYLYVFTLKNTTPYPVSVLFDDIAVDFTYASVPAPYYEVGVGQSIENLSYLYLITKVDIKTLMKNLDPYKN